MTRNRTRKRKTSTLSATFRKVVESVEPEKDALKAKDAHRATVGYLIQDYLDKVSEGDVPGIRNAKELLDFIKLDVLLMGEPTEISKDLSAFDELRIQQITESIDFNSPELAEVTRQIYGVLNETNDEHQVEISASNSKYKEEGLKLIEGTDQVEFDIGDPIAEEEEPALDIYAEGLGDM